MEWKAGWKLEECKALINFKFTGDWGFIQSKWSAKKNRPLRNGDARLLFSPYKRVLALNVSVVFAQQCRNEDVEVNILTFSWNFGQKHRGWTIDQWWYCGSLRRRRTWSNGMYFGYFWRENANQLKIWNETFLLTFKHCDFVWVTIPSTCASI